MCDFLSSFIMHGYACAFLVLLLSLAWIFSGVTMFFSLALPFSNNLKVMGSHVVVELDF